MDIKTSDILKALSAAGDGLDVYALRDALGVNASVNDLVEQLSLLSRQGHVHLVNGCLWRPHGVFPADAVGTLLSSSDATPSAWSDIRKLCRYYHDCNLLAGSKGMSLWQDREDTLYTQIPKELEWSLLSKGESIYLDENVLPMSMRQAFLRDFQAYLCGPLFLPKGNNPPIIPVFINTCAVEWVRQHGVVRITLTAHPEINEEWLAKVARNIERREDLIYYFEQNLPASDSDLSEKPPQPDFMRLYSLLRQLLLEDVLFEGQTREMPCLISPAPFNPLSKLVKTGYYNRLLLVRQNSVMFTQRLQRELRDISRAKNEELSHSALRFFTDTLIPGEKPKPVQPVPMQIETLSPDQRRAVYLSQYSDITFVKGPPGTGKSRVVANAMINALFEGQSVLFASRNHQALEAVVPYLNAHCKHGVVVGRLSVPYGENIEDPVKTCIQSLMDAISDMDDGDAVRQAVERVEAIRENLDKLRDALRERAQQHQDVLAKMSAAEACLNELGDDADFVFKGASRIDPNFVTIFELFAQRYLQHCISTPKFFLFRWLQNHARKRALRTYADRWSVLTNGFDEAFGDTNFLKSLRVFQLGAFNDSEARRCFEMIRNVFRTASAVVDTENARVMLDSGKTVSMLQEEIRTHEDMLCKASVKALSKRCETAGQGITDDERQIIANLRATMDVGGSDAKIRAMIRKSFPVLVRHAPLWAVSNLSAGRNLPLVPGLFDLLIIDEASQCDIPSVLPLMFRAKRIMVVGDDKQLSFVAGISKAANQRLRDRHGLGAPEPFDRFDFRTQSFFDLVNGLKYTRSECRAILRDHYRCGPEIADYFNKAFYREQLFINTETAKLKRPDKKRSSIRWHDMPADVRRNPGGGAISDSQVDAIVSDIKQLAERGFAGTVGVVSPFRAQANRISDRVFSAFNGATPTHWDFKSSTADGFQGGERDVIYLSLVGGPDLPSSCEWFYESDPNRFNVAISRARSVLHVFGNYAWTMEWTVNKDARKHIRLLAEMASLDDEIGPEDKEQTNKARPLSPPIDGDESLSGPVWEPRFAQALWDAGLPVRRQYRACGRSLDIALLRAGLKLGVEVDGEAFHRGPDGNRRQEDIERDLVLMANGWMVKRFWVYELRENWQRCINEVETIWKTSEGETE